MISADICIVLDLLPDVINHLYIFLNGKVPYYFNIP